MTVPTHHAPSEGPENDGRRQVLLEELAQSFDAPETAGIDLDLLREGKQHAWPTRRDL